MDNGRVKLMRTVQTADFAMTDTGLYLDTHPDDAKALEYYEKMRKIRNEAAAEYNRLYGPLRAEDTCTDKRWSWTDGPWPWQYTCDGKGQ